ncbi:MAG: FliH/SctL family protein [Myxococcota bacterium]|nr:FliH/SctL family protein [Myxococcota bacterium]
MNPARVHAALPPNSLTPASQVEVEPCRWPQVLREQRRDALQTSLQRHLAELSAMRKTELQARNEDLVSLAIAIAQRILLHDFEYAPARLQGLVEEMRERFFEAPARLIAGPAAYAALHTKVFAELELVEDEGARPWSLRFESQELRLDFGLERQLEACFAALCPTVRG